MAERTRQFIEVHADMTPYTAQVKAGIAAVGGYSTVPVTNPVGATVPVGGLGGAGPAANGSASEQAAIAGAMGQAQARAAQYGLTGPLSSPNWSNLMQNAVSGAMFPEGAASPNWAYHFEQQNRAIQSLAPTSSPNWSYLMGQRGAKGIGGGDKKSWYSGITQGRGLVGAFGLMEVAQAYRSVGEGSLQASLADTDVEAFGANVEGVTGGLGNLIGGVVGLAWNLGGDALGLGEYTPGGQRSVALTEAKRRSQLDMVQRNILTRRSDAYLRGVESTGGDFDLQRAKTQVEFESSFRRSDETAKAAYGRLNAGQSFKLLGFIPTGWWDAEVKDGGERAALATTARDAEMGKSEAVRARDHALMMVDRAQEDSILVRRGQSTLSRIARRDADIDVGLDTYALRDSAAGIGSRDVERRSFYRGAAETLSRTLRDDPGRAGTVGANLLAQEQALQAEWNRADDVTINALHAAAASNLLRAGGQDFQASLSDIRATTAAAVAQARQTGGPRAAETISALEAAGQSQVALAVGNQNRSFVQGSIAIGASSDSLSALLRNDPLAAQIASIHGNRDLALAGVTDNTFFGDVRRRQIGRNSDLQEQLARRNDTRHRSDIDRSLSGEIDRARLSIRGGPLAGIEMGLSSILQSADLDVRGLEDNGDTTNANKRRELASLQIDALRSSYFRSFRYEQDNPLNVVGQGNLSGLRTAIDNAKAGVAGLGRGEGQAGGEQAWTKQDVANLFQDLRNLFSELTGGARAG